MNTLIGSLILGSIFGFMALVLKGFSQIEENRKHPRKQ
jgi:hypothetical protein